ncbi:MAG TPA: pyruvate kinase [Thermomonas sp.]|jgi:pyruvate kinase|uniref:pyruvate kinase n=1 Tax=Thermomonas sp. TaxID=1971895 RepID=UPI002BC72AA4|nr:pyruvate kinase [Thermomonas sp.]HOU65106.1 pyruvate kinase [Thermomonas sp.]HOZ23891.1 pyruvate kinase [Thermomonas sp.]HPM57736.1 pyruvate kinase [Thermomonas sp.]HPW12778.1 pyruvate kinase [Thermomonas sp.]
MTARKTEQAAVPHQRRTRIVATLGPATDPPEMLEAVLRAGVDVVRLNFSHGDPSAQVARGEAVRAMALKIGREIGILADLPGPKIRVETFAEGKVALKAGNRFDLVASLDAPPGDATQVGVSYLELPGDVVAGDVLLLDDGVVQLQVTAVEGERIVTTVLNDCFLSNRKGLNKQGGGLSLGAITEKDRELIAIAAGMNVDFIAVSFCRNADDMNEARRVAKAHGSSAALVAKIERAEAIENLTEIVDASDVVMVARGDLGVEIGDAELPGLQKKIIREAVAREKVVITATQMLQSMVDSPIPTRAEVLDVANAVIDGTDAVMLSQESAAGSWPVKAVEAMARICVGAEKQFVADTDFEAAQRGLERADQAIAMATMFLSEHIGVRGVVAMTESGGTARFLSRFRSSVPIFAFSRHGPARRKMALMRDVFPMDYDSRGQTPREAARGSIRLLVDAGLLQPGDRVVFTSGEHMETRGATNTLRLLEIGEDGRAAGLGEL